MSRIVGNYSLGALLGRGGASEVYAAEHRFLGDPVAVKLLRAEPGDGDAAGEAFVAEATRTRSIDHPAVVRVHDFGRDQASGRWYLVMERVEGETLAARLARVGRLGEAEVRRLGAAIAAGMQAAHERGIVHRDLKPANIVLQGDQPKVIDFGIATHLDGRAAVTTGRRIGTPAYMAPEQLSGGLIGPFVDVWALGVTLFEAVTGRLPFRGFDDGRCPQLFETAPRAADLAPVSPAFDTLLARCLERDPGRRPASMAEVATALDGAAGDERFTVDLGPPGAAMVSAPVAAPRPHRRWWWIAGAGAAVLAAAFAITAGRGTGTASETIDAGSPEIATDARSPEVAADAGTPAPVAARPDAAARAPVEASPPDRVEPDRPGPRPQPRPRPRPRSTEETLD
jgi:eukaryotic-like serine/threonine-protein kinase